MNIIEKLEIYIADNLEGMPSATLTTIAEQLRAIIDEFKSPQDNHHTQAAVIPCELLSDLLVAADLLRGRNNKVADRLANHFTRIMTAGPSDETVKDAERYRWLRSRQDGNNGVPLICRYKESVSLWNGSMADEVIDEAMKASNAET